MNHSPYFEIIKIYAIILRRNALTKVKCNFALTDSSIQKRRETITANNRISLGRCNILRIERQKGKKYS